MKIFETMMGSNPANRRQIVLDIMKRAAPFNKEIAAAFSIEEEPEHYFNQKGNRYIGIAGNISESEFAVSTFIVDRKASGGYFNKRFYRILTPHMGFVCDEGIFLEYEGDDLNIVAYQAVRAIYEHVLNWTDEEGSESFVGREKESEAFIDTNCEESFKKAYAWLQIINDIISKGE